MVAGAPSTRFGLMPVFVALGLHSVLAVPGSPVATSGAGQLTPDEWRAKLETVHVVSMTHLDIGWTDLAGSVCEWYFHSWFPAALQTIEELRARGDPANQFVVQTHPWILQELLYGSAGCTPARPSQTTIARVRAEMSRGTIAWQAKPFNMLVELAPSALLDWSFGIGQKLNREFNQTWGLAATSADVCGISLGAVPVLAAHGVRAIHMGYNNGGHFPTETGIATNSHLSESRTFRWQHSAGGAEVIVMNEPAYGDRVVIPGCPDALVFDFHSDNTLPPTVDQHLTFLNSTRAQFPGASVRASSLDNFVASLEKCRHLLPLVTGVEVGDSWLSEAGTDPFLYAGMRQVVRIWQEWLAAGRISASDPSLNGYLSRLLKIPEHNIGPAPPWDAAESKLWTNAQFQPYYKHAVAQAMRQKTRSVKAVPQTLVRNGDWIPWVLANGTNVAGTTVNGTVCDDARAAHCDPTPLLGVFNSVAECQNACTVQPNCTSFSYALCSIPDGPFPCHCYGRSDFHWSPAEPNAGLISGRRFHPPNGFQLEYIDTIEAHRRWLWPSSSAAESSQNYTAFAAQVNKTLAAMHAKAAPAAAVAASAKLSLVKDLSSRTSIVLSAGQIQAEINTTSGSISSMTARGHRFSLGDGYALAQIVYRTFSGAEETKYTESFMPGGEGCWGKPGLAAAIAADQSFPLTDAEVGREWMPSVKQIWTDSSATATMALVRLELPALAQEQFSGPEELQLNYSLSSGSDALHVTVTWKNRTLSRMPSAFFLGFNVKPNLQPNPPGRWTMDVLGSPIDPLNVSYNGAKRLHAVDRGICFQEASDHDISSESPQSQSAISSSLGKALSIESLDAPLVNPGDTNQTLWDNRIPALGSPGSKGAMHFVLSDNALWDCIWTYDNEDSSFRFVLRVEDQCWGGGS